MLAYFDTNGDMNTKANILQYSLYNNVVLNYIKNVCGCDRIILGNSFWNIFMKSLISYNTLKTKNYIFTFLKTRVPYFPFVFSNFISLNSRMILLILVVEFLV